MRNTSFDRYIVKTDISADICNFFLLSASANIISLCVLSALLVKMFTLIFSYFEQLLHLLKTTINIVMQSLYFTDFVTFLYLFIFYNDLI